MSSKKQKKSVPLDTKTTETAQDQPATADIKPGDLVSIVAEGETISRDHKVIRVLKISTRMTLVLAENLLKQ